MLGKRLYIAVFISAMLHAAFIAVATYVSHWPSEDISGGIEAGDTIAITVLSEDIRTELPSKMTKAQPTIKHERKRDSTEMVAPLPTHARSEESVSSEKTQERTAKASQSTPSTGQGIEDKPGPGSGDSKKQLARIWSKINRSKYYPLHARRNLWEGKPRVTFKIGKEGEVEYVRLSKSCGITLLDEAAIETVRRAAPLPAYAKPITLTIRYSLKN